MQLLLILLTVLESLLTTMETRTLQANFTLTISENATQPLSYRGSLTMQGPKFLLNAMGQEMAYDGLTLYSYSQDLDELTLSEPTEADLLMTNPFLFARAIYKECNITERRSQDGKSDIITLTPRDQSLGIQRFVLSVRDGIPQSGEVVEGKKTTRVVLQNPKFIPTPPSWTVNHPNAYVNDLR